LKTAASGTAIGILVALAGARVLGGLLHGLAARDPITFVAAGGVLIIASAAACVVPARRATRIAPTDALHME
jgi:ABC-type antimicrobial peptide transport system permease subunit